MNSLLGLVVFTCEKEFVRFTLKERLIDLTAKGWPSWTFQMGGSSRDTLGTLAYHLRNGIAHARLTFSSDSPVPSDVQIEDAHPKTKRIHWRASITAADLLTFCSFYAEHIDDVIR